MTRVLVVALVCACHGPGPTSGVQASDAVVSIASNVKDAELFVDGRDVGPLVAVRGGVALSPGVHRFELRRQEFFSSYLELALARSEHKKVAMDMSPILP